MQIRIVAGSNAAIYKQIANQISRSVAAGELEVGMLPSVRQLARELVINPNTVAKAYADLVQAGILGDPSGQRILRRETPPSLHQDRTHAATR